MGVKSTSRFMSNLYNIALDEKKSTSYENLKITKKWVIQIWKTDPFKCGLKSEKKTDLLPEKLDKFSKIIKNH